MSLQVIEGTWEEIQAHKAELIGRHLRVTVKPEKRMAAKQSPSAAPPKQLTGFGAFKGKIGSSEAFAKEKRAEIEREDARF